MYFSNCELRIEICTHVHAHLHVCNVLANMLSKSVGDVCACGSFSSVRCVIAISHVLVQKRINFTRFWAKKTRISDSHTVS